MQRSSPFPSEPHTVNSNTRNDRALQLLLAIRLPSQRTARAARNCEHLLELLDTSALTASAPLHWILPSAPVVESRDEACVRLVSEIKARVQRRGDLVIPAGYSGTPTALLSSADARREIEWGIRNPWDTGLEATFGCEIHAAAGEVDLRPRVCEAYSSLGINHLLLPVGALAPVLDGLRTSQFLELTHVEQAGVRLPAASTLLVIPADAADPEATLEALLDRLQHGDPPHLLSLLEISGSLAAPGAFVGARPVDWDPMARMSRLAAEPARGSRGGDNQLRQGLLRLQRLPVSSGPASTPPAMQAANPGPSMQGAVSLKSDTIEARFNQGMLTGLHGAAGEFALPEPASAFVDADDRRIQAILENAFGFDGGLRTELRLPLPGGTSIQVWITYFLPEDVPALAVDVEIRYPRHITARQLQVAPLHIPLFRLRPRETATAVVSFSARDSYEQPIAAQPGPLQIHGKLVTFTQAGRGLCVATPDPMGLTGHTFEVARLRQRRATLVAVNLLGTHSPTPADRFQEIRERAAFLVSPRSLLDYVPVEGPTSQQLPHHTVEIGG